MAILGRDNGDLGNAIEAAGLRHKWRAVSDGKESFLERVGQHDDAAPTEADLQAALTNRKRKRLVDAADEKARVLMATGMSGNETSVLRQQTMLLARAARLMRKEALGTITPEQRAKLDQLEVIQSKNEEIDDAKDAIKIDIMNGTLKTEDAVNGDQRWPV